MVQSIFSIPFSEYLKQCVISLSRISPGSHVPRYRRAQHIIIIEIKDAV